MGEPIKSTDPLADVRHRAPALANSHIDYGLLPELTGFSVQLTWLLAHALLMKELGEPGITPHRFSVLEVVGRNPGLQPGQIATALALTRPATTLALDFWEDRGCIERLQLPDDRRSYEVYATSFGLGELERLRARTKKADEALTSHLTDGETKKLRRILEKIHL